MSPPSGPPSAWIWVALALLLAAVSLAVGERFPLSDWPMYAAPGAVRGVVVVADGQGLGVYIEGLTGRSASRVQKRLSRSGSASVEARVDDVGCDLRRQAAARGAALPADASLWWLDLSRTVDDGAVSIRPLRLGPIPLSCEAP